MGNFGLNKQKIVELESDLTDCLSDLENIKTRLLKIKAELNTINLMS